MNSGYRTWNSSASIVFQKSNTAKQTDIRDLWLTVTVRDQHEESEDG